MQELAGNTLAGFLKGLSPQDEAAVRDASLAALNAAFPAGRRSKASSGEKATSSGPKHRSMQQGATGAIVVA